MEKRYPRDWPIETDPRVNFVKTNPKVAFGQHTLGRRVLLRHRGALQIIVVYNAPGFENCSGGNFAKTNQSHVDCKSIVLRDE
jgi:hypothetical protein